MPSPKKKEASKWSIYILLGVLCIVAGILYTRFQEGSVQEVIPETVRSQSVPSTSDVPKLSEEKILARITQLEKEILEDTNDPARALKLRRELQSMKEQLEKVEIQ